MANDLTAALDAATRAGWSPSSAETLTGAVNYGALGTHDLGEALDRLTKGAGQTTRQDKTLPPRATPPAIPARAGASGRVAATGTASGIAGPLTEPDAATRTYWSDVTLTSTDGLFAIRVRPLKRIDLQDALANPVVINFDQP